MIADPDLNVGAQGELRLTSRFTSAVEYARGVHQEMREGTKIPYMAHLLGLAAMVMGESGHAWVPVTEDIVIAALLHDAAEDHGGEGRLKDIEDHFGVEVARMVASLSDSLVGNADQKESWLERKTAYLLRLRGEPADVRLISVADKLYNARSILDDYRGVGTLIWDRFKRGREDQLWYFEELLKVYRTFPAIRIANEYSHVVAALRQISAGEEPQDSR